MPKKKKQKVKPGYFNLDRLIRAAGYTPVEAEPAQYIPFIIHALVEKQGKYYVCNYHTYGPPNQTLSAWYGPETEEKARSMYWTRVYGRRTY